MNQLVRYIIGIATIVCMLVATFYPRIQMAAKVQPAFYRPLNILCFLGIQLIVELVYPGAKLITAIIFYYLVFRKELNEERSDALFQSLYIFLAYESIFYFLTSLVYHFVVIDYWSLIAMETFHMGLALVSLALALVVQKYLALDWELMKDRYFDQTIRRANCYLVALTALRFLAMMVYNFYYDQYIAIKISASLVLFMCTLLVSLYLRNQQLAYQYQRNIAEKKRENLQLNQMVDELAALYSEVRGFRHDFAGIVNALEPAIEEQDIVEVTRIYQDVLVKMNQTLRRGAYSGFNMTNIKEIGFRNVLAQKWIQAKNEQIPFTLEVTGEIPCVDVPLLEIVRMLTILLDNALEGARTSDTPQVTVSLVPKNDCVYLEICNTYHVDEPLNQQKIWQNGYSTKGVNRGLGLSNLQEIMWKLETVELETRMTKSEFSQLLIFRKRGVGYDENCHY